MSASKRMKEYLKNKGIKPAQFSRDTGFGNSYLDNVVNLGSEKINIILESYPDLNVEWLISGKGEMVKTEPTVVNEPPAPYGLSQAASYIENEIQELKDRLDKLEGKQTPPTEKREHKPVPFTSGGKSTYDKKKEIAERARIEREK